MRRIFKQALAPAFGLVWLAACGGLGRPLAPGPGPGGEDLTGLGGTHRITLLDGPATAEDLEGWPRQGVVLVRGRATAAQVAPPVAEAIRAWVADGGTLVLEGSAAALAHTLGFEERPPDREETVAWGFDERSRLGRYLAGYRLLGGADGLARRLVPEPDRGPVFLVRGGEPALVDVTSWSALPPAGGEVWGLLVEQRDARGGASRDAVLVHWPVGHGHVVAAGLALMGPGAGSAPAPGDPLGPLRAAGGELGAVAERITANRASFLPALLAHLRGEGGQRSTGRPALTVIPMQRWPGHTERPRPALQVGTAAVPGRDLGRDNALLPGRPQVAHWGWRVHANRHHRTREATAPQQVLQDVVQPSFQAGADLLDLGLVDSRRGLPLPWLATDPMRRPRDFRGEAFWPGWSSARVRGLAAELAGQGGLLQLALDPMPLNRPDRRQQLALLRWLGRELMDPRLFGDDRVRGLGIGGVAGDGAGADGRGLTQQILQDHTPDGWLMGLEPPFSGDPVGRDPADGVLAALPAMRGQPFGIPAHGLSRRWRGTGEPDSVHVALLDAHTRPPDEALWGERVQPVGSYGDWVVRQAQDFLRPRVLPYLPARGAVAPGAGELRAPVMLWDAWNRATLDPETQAYAQAVAQAGLDAALAMRLWATGRGGARDLLRQQVRTEVQAGFGAVTPLPAHTPVLQNGHLQLFGSGGALRFDPTGCADFDGPRGVEITPRLRHTLYRGVPPSPPEHSPVPIDLLAGGTGSSGGYQEVLPIERGGVGARRFPAVIARNRAPEWPQVVRVMCRPVPGSYLLHARLRGVTGSGFVEFRRDGELLHLLPFQSGRPGQAVTLPVSLTRAAVRELEFGIVAGGAVAFEELVLQPVQDLATEAWITSPGGHRAELVEQTASPYQDQQLRLAMVAGMPAFTIWDDRQRAERGLFHKTVFPFPGLRTVRYGASGEDPERRQQPFVLDGAGGVAVAVLPLRLGRYEGFRLDPAEGLILEGPVRPFQEMAVGFYLLDKERWGGRIDRDVLRALRDVLERVAEPRAVRPGSNGARFVHEHGIPWVEVVEVHHPAGTPVRVRENGYWLHRGVQRMPGRSDAGWVRLFHRPGDAVLLRTGRGIWRGIRPAVGSLHCVALGDPEEVAGATALDVVVTQLSPLVGAPGVTFPEPFDEVTLNGRPWAYHDGRTVHLPQQRGVWRVRVTRHGALPSPRLLATRLDVRECAYDRVARELRITAWAEPGRPASAPAILWLDGPEPTGWSGCSPVAPETLRYATAADGMNADRAGRLFLVQPGQVVLGYGGAGGGAATQAAEAAGEPPR